MDEKGIIIRFRVASQRGETLHDDGGVSEMEFWEAYQELIDRQDYPGLVRYAKQQAERYPDDPYAQYYLGDAYVLNGEYGKAIEFMTEYHRSNPWNSDFQHVILDALFALAKTEDDFDWVGKPVVLRMSQDIVDSCYELLRRKRNPRTVTELHSQFISKGYLLFTEDDLLQALVKDGRFTVENPDSVFSAQIRIDSKKRR
jgi:tetratricopeptide (TPR) repeat protein